MVTVNKYLVLPWLQYINMSCFLGYRAGGGAAGTHGAREGRHVGPRGEIPRFTGESVKLSLPEHTAM